MSDFLDACNALVNDQAAIDKLRDAEAPQDLREHLRDSMLYGHQGITVRWDTPADLFGRPHQQQFYGRSLIDSAKESIRAEEQERYTRLFKLWGKMLKR